MKLFQKMLPDFLMRMCKKNYILEVYSHRYFIKENCNNFVHDSHKNRYCMYIVYICKKSIFEGKKHVEFLQESKFDCIMNNDFF